MHADFQVVLVRTPESHLCQAKIPKVIMPRSAYFRDYFFRIKILDQVCGRIRNQFRGTDPDNMVSDPPIPESERQCMISQRWHTMSCHHRQRIISQPKGAQPKGATHFSAVSLRENPDKILHGRSSVPNNKS